jgi:hypothetical protein
MSVSNPLVGVGGNVFQLLLDNFCPPFFPKAGWLNQNAAEILPHTLVAMSAKFNNGLFHLWELPSEDWAGLGFGVSMLLAICATANFCRAAGATALQKAAVPAEFCRLVLIAPWLALLFYCAKSGMDNAARLISPYYPLLLPLLLSGAAQSEIVRRRWWRILVFGNLVLAFAVLILTPGRELWPAQTILSKLAAKNPDSQLFSRAQKVYSVYSSRSDPLAGVRDLLPKNISVVGFLGGPDDADISLWQPFGTRRVEHFFLTDTPEQIRRLGIQYAAVNGAALQDGGTTIEDWFRQSGAELIGETNVTLKVSAGMQPWYVVRFKNRVAN